VGPALLEHRLSTASALLEALLKLPPEKHRSRRKFSEAKRTNVGEEMVRSCRPWPPRAYKAACMAHQNSSLLIRPRSRVKNQQRMASLHKSSQ
jgi:hypothetical protein